MTQILLEEPLKSLKMYFFFFFFLVQGGSVLPTVNGKLVGHLQSFGLFQRLSVPLISLSSAVC